MENELLLARTKDTIDSVFYTDRPKYLGFLSVEEAAFVRKYLENHNIKHSFFGGADDCERVFLGCFPEWMQQSDFPITAITFTYRTVDVLRHRDFLGALMALGIKREAIGDILIEQGRAVIFFSGEIADYVLNNLEKVGNVGVTGVIGFLDDLPCRDNLKENTVTVASLRLDCVVSALANCSRNTACGFIESGLVAVNSVVCQKTTKILSFGDILSVRHKGKFKITSTDKKTKKDRTVLVYKSY